MKTFKNLINLIIL